MNDKDYSTMNRKDKTATEILADMTDLQARLHANRCVHCKQRTIVVVMDGDDPTIHCVNRDCGGYFATMQRSQFEALTQADLESRKGGRTSLAGLEQPHADRMAEIEAVIEAAAARAAIRKANEKVYA